jgi:NADH dehydrogenase
MEDRTVTVFGGTGFLGRRIVEALARLGCTVRVAARHPERSGAAIGDVRPMTADVRDGLAVARAAEGAVAVVNAVSLYREGRDVSFREIHVDAARRVAEAVRARGVARLVHLSGIGSDPASSSPYIRARGDGEVAVRDGFAAATLLRPSAMFGPDDPLITALLHVTRLPAVPLFGHGHTRLQPVFVGDVAEAAARLATGDGAPEPIYEFGGPDVITYRELVELTLRATGRRRPLVPVPFAVWEAIAAGARLLPSPPITEGQVALMRKDNVASLDLPGLGTLGIEPRPLGIELDQRTGRG